MIPAMVHVSNTGIGDAGYSKKPDIRPSSDAL